MKNLITKVAVASLLLVPQTMQAKSEHLLPRPQEITLTAQGSAFALGGTVSITDPTDCKALQEFFTSVGCTIGEGGSPVTVTLGAVDGSYDFELAGFPNEAYSLEITASAINIVAVTPTGVIRAAQTLAQLAQGYEGTPALEALTMKDWPAFKLRGFMHDVGRSFMSVAELKKQIDALAKFKVNTFHWHFTENQAWRFEVKAYPQLTSAESMTRFAGQYYTQDEVKEVQDYAYERGMVIIPEIDMPGHSAAFTRAMGHDMQTDEGVAELKVIIKEVCELFDKVEYVHIGGDEVTITYPDFLETMIAEVKKCGKKVAVWNPINGVNVANLDADMTQMWSSRGAKIAGKASIDCRYNYTNHFDVFADLVGIYRSNIYYQERGDADVPGFLSCPWNDRKTPTEDDIIRQNNFYANVIASTERAWIGGGEGYIETLGTMLPNTGEGYEEFADWERRFLFHKATTLSAEADLIPYVKQTNVRWRITDPFPNGGNSATVFAPEEQGTAVGTEMMDETFTHEGKTYYTGMATGAGIYLRHTWGNDIMPTFYGSTNYSNVTSYAWTYVYSPVEQTVGAQIEFHNYGRSENDKAPDAGKWDRKGSDIWINGERVAPPTWGNSGKSIGHEVDLLNENFTARTPLQVTLKQGWNKVFLKLPYVDADGVRLKKWMFTCVFTDTEGKNAVDGLIYSPNQCMDEVTEQVAMKISEVRRSVNAKIGTKVGYYPASVATDILAKLTAIEGTLSTSMDAEGRASQIEEINTAKAAFDAALLTATPNLPISSTATEIHYYSLKDKRGGKYVTSGGAGNGVTGTTSASGSYLWKFVQRTGTTTFDIINTADNSYLDPSTGSGGQQLRTSSSQPTNAWSLNLVADGYVTITSGTSQLHQATSANVLNWGSGTNTTDGGCLYQIEETEYVPPVEPEDPEAPHALITLANGTFTSSNAGKTWHSVWSSTQYEGLRLSTSANNMQPAPEDGNLLACATGGGCTYTLTAPAGIKITGYSFGFKNSSNTTNQKTVTVNGTAYTSSATVQNVSVTGLNANSVEAFKMSGNNSLITLSDFYVYFDRDPNAPAENVDITSGYYKIKSKDNGLYLKNEHALNASDVTYVETMTDPMKGYFVWKVDITGSQFEVMNSQGTPIKVGSTPYPTLTVLEKMGEKTYVFDNHLNRSNQGSNTVIYVWPDDGTGVANQWVFEELEGTAYSVTLQNAPAGTAVTRKATGDQVMNGGFFFYETGSAEPQESDFSAPAMAGKEVSVVVDNSAKTITVKYEMKIIPTTIEDGQFAENTQWYFLQMTGSKYVVANHGTDDRIRLNSNFLYGDAQEQWCFVKNDDGSYKLYNREAGATMVLASTSSLSGDGGSTYPILKDEASLPSDYVASWDLSRSDKISGTEGWYFALHGHSSYVLNNRGSAVAYWTGGKDAGSTFIITPTTFESQISLATGVFSGTGEFHETWSSSEVAGLTFGTSDNNMKADNDDASLISCFVGSGTRYTLTAPEGYVIRSYSFDYKLRSDNADATVNIDGVQATTTATTVSKADYNKSTFSFTLSGDNEGITLSNFTVVVAKKEVPRIPSVIVFLTAGQSIPYRIPAIAQTKNGNLVAVADYRYSKQDIGMADNGKLDLRYSISTDRGATWSEIKTLVAGQGSDAITDASNPNQIDVAFGDPCIVADSESDNVLVMSCAGNVSFPNGTPNNHQYIVTMRSDNNGETWGNREDVTEQFYGPFNGGANAMFIGSGKISQSKTIKKGEYYRIYCAVLMERTNDARVNYAFYSDDFGRTWNVLGGVDVAPIPSGADEPKADELPDGSVLVSSRVNGGRYFNIFRYTDIEKGEGYWSTCTFSGSDNGGTASPGYTCNGEILTVPVTRKSDNKDMYLQLQSVPFGDGRQNLGIYYKELETLTDFNSGASIAKDWDGRFQVSYITSCYSTMVMLDDNTIAFLYEENSTNSGYDIRYMNLTVEQITENGYTLNPNVDATAIVAAGMGAELEAMEAKKGNKVGNLLNAGYMFIEDACNAYVASPSSEAYVAFNRAVNDAAYKKLYEGVEYRANNKAYPTKYLKLQSGGLRSEVLDENSAAQKLTFAPGTVQGSWIIKGSDAWLGNTGSTEDDLVAVKTSAEEAANYLVVSNSDGLTYFRCLTPDNATYPDLHDKGDGRVVRWTASSNSSQWYVAPLGIYPEEQIDAIIVDCRDELALAGTVGYPGKEDEVTVAYQTAFDNALQSLKDGAATNAIYQALVDAREAFNDIVTGIDDVLNGSTEKADDTTYDLQGRRVVTPSKAGVYIQNGKKVFIK